MEARIPVEKEAAQKLEFKISKSIFQD